MCGRPRRLIPPTFEVLVEIQSWDRVAIHGDVAGTVDSLLRGFEESPEIREVDDEGNVKIISTVHQAEEQRAVKRKTPESSGPLRNIYPFGISRRRLEQAVRQTGAPVTVAEHLKDADVVITLRNYYRRKLPALREAEARGVPVHVLRANTVAQIEQGLLSLHPTARDTDPVTSALEEAEVAAAGIAQGERDAELSPQNAYIRRLQHELAQRYNLSSRSLGREPRRRVRMYRDNDVPFDA